MRNLTGLLAAASMALVLPATPAHAGGDITNFKVKNCTSERVFVCSFDKTDSLMTIPYKARGLSAYDEGSSPDKKEFGCASLDKCKVIIGASKKKSTKTLSSGMQAALTTGAVSGGVTAGVGAGILLGVEIVAAGATTGIVAAGGIIVGAVIAVGVGGAVAGIEIADGWKDGDVCNQVRKAAQKAGMKPKSFMKDGKTYRVIEQYATDANGNPYLNPDGTAVIAYSTELDKGSCPKPLEKQLIKD